LHCDQVAGRHRFQRQSSAFHANPLGRGLFFMPTMPDLQISGFGGE
jgi:hypothetical protein